MKKGTWTGNRHADRLDKAGRWIKLLTFGLLSVSLITTATAGPREQAKRIHDRLAGVPPTELELQAMEAEVDVVIKLTLRKDDALLLSKSVYARC